MCGLGECSPPTPPHSRVSFHSGGWAGPGDDQQECRGERVGWGLTQGNKGPCSAVEELGRPTELRGRCCRRVLEVRTAIRDGK